MENNLGLFFTKGMSVQLWAKNGILDREKLIYEKLLEKKVFNKIYWFTYGSNEKQYQRQLKTSIIIIQKPIFFNWRGGNTLYSFLLPIIQKTSLRQCAVFKTNQMWGGWSAVISKWLYGKPLYCRTGWTTSIVAKITNKKISRFLCQLNESLVYKWADISSVSTDEQKKYVQKKFSPPNEIRVIPNYIDTNLFKPLPLEKNGDLIFVGRLTEQKNLFNLIQAAKEANCSLDIYGSGNLEKQLKDLNCGLQAKVKFWDNIPNTSLPQVLNQYKIFIMPSRYETVCKSLLEAMACGLACVSTNVFGTREVIKNEYNGLLINTDPQSIHDAINRLLNDEVLRKKIGNNARNTILNHYNIENIIKREINIYHALNLCTLL